MTYDPMPSVWEGEDGALLERMLQFYPKSQPERVLDATSNSKRFWRGSTRPVVGLDIDLRYRPEVVGTSTCLPFRSNAFDVVVYDPPHMLATSTNGTDWDPRDQGSGRAWVSSLRVRLWSLRLSIV